MYNVCFIFFSNPERSMGGGVYEQLKPDNHKDDGKQLLNNLVWYSVKKIFQGYILICICFIRS